MSVVSDFILLPCTMCRTHTHTHTHTSQLLLRLGGHVWLGRVELHILHSVYFMSERTCHEEDVRAKVLRLDRSISLYGSTTESSSNEENVIKYFRKCQSAPQRHGKMLACSSKADNVPLSHRWTFHDLSSRIGRNSACDVRWNPTVL